MYTYSLNVLGQLRSHMSGQSKRLLVNASPGPVALDAAVMSRWPDTHQSRLLDTFAVRLSQAGEVSAVWFTAAVIAFLVGRLSTRAAVIAVAVIVAEWVLTNRVVKRYLWRPRPIPTLPDPRGVRRPSSSSLPSGHSSASACAATFVGSQTGWLVALAALAFLLGCSRAHLRVHYPTDVMAGWVWGIVLGCAALVVLA
jgi:membrane-associated phospholipid phosphatase